MSCSRPAAHLVQEEQEQECLQGSHLRKTSRLIQNERRLNPLWEIWRGADAHAAEALLWSPAREKERGGERRRRRKEEEVRGGKQSLSKPSATFFKYFFFLGKGPRTSHVFKSYLENRTIKLFFFSSHRFLDVIPRFSRVRWSESSSVNPLVVRGKKKKKRVLKSSRSASASQDAGWILPRAAAGTLWASLQTSWSGCMRRLSWGNTPLKLKKKKKKFEPKTRGKLKAIFLP